MRVFFSRIEIVLLSYVGIYLVVSVDVWGEAKSGLGFLSFERVPMTDRCPRPASITAPGGRIECPLCVHTAAREQPYSNILKAIFAVHLRRVLFARLRKGVFRAEDTFRRLLNYFGVKDNQQHP